MVLTRLQRRRFYSLLDKLTLYANEQLEVLPENELRADGERELDEQAQGRILRKLWQRPELIDSYVDENPDGLSAGEVSLLSSWRDGLSGTFIVDAFPDGKVRFIAGGCGFDVVGISQEPVVLVDYYLPCAVQATLIPFDGVIVFAGGFVSLPIDFDEERIRSIEENVDDICAHDTFVSTGEDLLKMAIVIREKGLIADANVLLDALEEAGSDYQWKREELAPGVSRSWPSEEDDEFDWEDDWDAGLSPEDIAQHRGCLAGMTREERDEAVRAHMDEDGFGTDRLVGLLDEQCLEGPVERGLSGLLARDNAHDVYRFLRFMGIDGDIDLKGNDRIEAIVEHIADERVLQDIVNEMPERQVIALHELADRGGIWEVDEKGISSLAELPMHETALCYIFHNDDRFTFVMPDEALDVARALDWDEALGCARRYRELVSFADAIADLRGIALLSDMYGEYRTSCTSDPYETDGDVFARLMQAIGEDRAGFGLFEEEGGGLYLVHRTLLEVYDEEQGRQHNPLVRMPITKGKLEGSLGAIRERQASKKPRPLTREMMEAPNLFEWRYSQDAAQAFVRYLDEHVPKMADDYYFADTVVEMLLDVVTMGVDEGDADALFDVLQSEFFVADPDQLQETLDLWVELAETQPAWIHNGWSKRELANLDAR